MKRFIISTIAVTIFFVGVGALVQNTGAKFKSDDKALALVAKARQALGGDSAIRTVQGLRIIGSTTKTFSADGQTRTVTGDTEIAMQFPDKFMRNFSSGNEAKGERTNVLSKEVTVTVNGDGNGNFVVHRGEGKGEGTGVGVAHELKLVVKNPDGTTQELSGADAEKWIAEHKDAVGEGHQIMLRKTEGRTEDLKIGDAAAGGIVVRKMKGDEGAPLKTADGDQVIIRHGDGAMGTAVMIRHNDFLKTALGLLMTAPDGADVTYTYAGEADLDGAGCNVIVATAGPESYKLYLDKSSNLPVGMTFRGEPAAHAVAFTVKADGNNDGAAKTVVTSDGEKRIFLQKSPDGTDTANGLSEIKRLPAAEYTVHFSDYRDVNGVQLPFRWTTTGAGSEEVFNVSNYEINPANLSQKFEKTPEVMKMRKSVN